MNEAGGNRTENGRKKNEIAFLTSVEALLSLAVVLPVSIFGDF